MYSLLISCKNKRKFEVSITENDTAKTVLFITMETKHIQDCIALRGEVLEYALYLANSYKVLHKHIHGYRATGCAISDVLVQRLQRENGVDPETIMNGYLGVIEREQ